MSRGGEESNNVVDFRELEGPDLGSDESPRSSIMNGNIHHDWMGQFEGKPDEIKSEQLSFCIL